MRVWVTRAEPGAEATARRLRELGHHPLISPVLEVRGLDAVVDFNGVGAVAFTSANAVRAAPPAAYDYPAFTVGDATAQAARDAGIEHVFSAQGDASALVDLLREQAPLIRDDILYLCAREPAADLVGMLRERSHGGVRARQAAVYATISAEPVEALESLGSLDAALVHSPKAARRLVELLDPAAVPALAFACISDAAAAPLRAAGHEKVLAAPFPDEAALLKLLEDDQTHRV